MQGRKDKRNQNGAVAKARRVIMLGTEPESPNKGGIWAVTSVYRREGLFDRWEVAYVGTHTAGKPIAKIAAALRGFAKYLPAVLDPSVAIVHAHVASRSSFWRKGLFISLASALGKSTICHLHGAEFEHFYENECGPIRRRLIRALFGCCTRVVVLSESWKRYIAELVSEERIRVLPNPVEIPNVEAGVRTDDGAQLLFLGRLGRRKGIYDLIEAMRLIHGEVEDVRLICAGDGEVEKVAEAVRRLGLDGSVSVVGWVDGSAKQCLLSESDVFVLPSHNEGLPVAMLEAMAAGLPVISTRVGGIPDALEDGVEGILIEAGDVSALAEAITHLVGNASLRGRMGRAARQRASCEFAASSVVGRLEAIYEELIDENQRLASRCSGGAG